MSEQADNPAPMTLLEAAFIVFGAARRLGLEVDSRKPGDRPTMKELYAASLHSVARRLVEIDWNARIASSPPPPESPAPAADVVEQPDQPKLMTPSRAIEILENVEGHFVAPGYREDPRAEEDRNDTRQELRAVILWIRSLEAVRQAEAAEEAFLRGDFDAIDRGAGS